MKLRFAFVLLICMLTMVMCGTKANVGNYEHGVVTITPGASSTPSATPNAGSPTDIPATGEPVATSEPEATAAPTATPEAAKPTAAPTDKKYVAVLDPGHGGTWSGAVSGSFKEAEITLRIANYCRKYLEAYYPQIDVYMTRTDANALSTDLVQDLKMRVEFAKEKNADILVSMHLNAYNTTNSGCMICAQHRENVKEDCARLSSLVLDQLEALGLKSNAMTNGVRKGIYYRNSSEYKDENGKPLEYYAICRHAANVDLVGIIVEHCYIDNKSDQQYIDSDDDIMKLGIADAKAIAAYFGLE